MSARARAVGLALLFLAGCSAEAGRPVTEIVAPAPLQLSLRGHGELVPGKATPLRVPGNNWDSRTVQWMLAEGSFVHEGEVVARFASLDGQQDLAQAMVDLQRNQLARLAKEQELSAGQRRVAVDLSQVGMQLGIAERYASADLSTLARNEVLDAVQDQRFLGEKRDTLEWKQGRTSMRGAAELSVIDAQRTTYQVNADARQQDLDALVLRAPNDGVVMLERDWSGEKPVVGTTMRAGSEYGSLPDTSAMEVKIVLPQLDAQVVAKGNAVVLHPIGRPAQSIRTSLSWVASVATVRSNVSPVKYLAMKAPVPQAAVRRFGLVPGQQMTAQVLLLDARDAISVANIALRSENGRHFVQLRKGGGFEQREVTLGARGTARSQVLGGLAKGDEVLLAPAGSSDVDAGRDAEGDTGTTGQTPGAGP